MTMREDKKKRLERAEWRVGTADDFLEISPAESTLLDLKAELGKRLREWRTTVPMTQATLAKSIGSSQSRIAKIEAGDPSVSLDLLVHALIGLGASKSDLADAINAA
jgi:DNA-binding XRE family transcriptional regulator